MSWETLDDASVPIVDKLIVRVFSIKELRSYKASKREKAGNTERR
nr:hypothetical protein [Mycoplasmopsis agalactiae]